MNVKSIFSVTILCLIMLALLACASGGKSLDSSRSADAASLQNVEIYPQIGMVSNARNYPEQNFSPDGKWIFGSAGIFDAANGRELRRPFSTSIIGFSPDMKRYLQRSDTTIRVRDWETDEINAIIQNIKPVNEQRVESGPVFSPDGKQVAAISADGKRINIWDATNGQEIMAVDGWENGVLRFHYSADGNTMVLANTETVKIFDLANRHLLRSFSAAVDANRDTILSPSGKILATANTTGTFNTGYSGSVKLYDIDTGRELRTLSGHNHFITALAYSPDGQRIISIDRDNMMKVWDAGNGRELSSTKLKDDYIHSLAFRADNRQIVYSVSNNKIIVSDAKNYRELLVIASLPRITNTSYAVNEKQALVQTDSTLSLWDTETGCRVWTMPHQGSILRYIYLSSNKRLFARVDSITNYLEQGFNIGIYDTITGRLLQSWSGGHPMAYIIDVIWDSNGKEITTLSGKGNHYFFDCWNTENGQNISNYVHGDLLFNEKSTPYLNHDAMRVAYLLEDSLQVYETQGTRKLLTITGSFDWALWSPDDTRILTTASDGTVRIWDAQSGREIPSAIKHGNLSDVAYNPDGKQFATGGRNGWVAAWNAENSAKLWEKWISSPVSSISYTTNGKEIIAITDGGVYILDSANGEVLFLKSEQKSASCSPDGKWILSGSSDNTVRIWSAETSAEKTQLVAFNDGEWLAMTPDGYYVASAKGDQYLNARIGNTVSGIDRYRSHFNKPAVVQARLSNSTRMSSHKDPIISVAVNPSSTRIASVSHDKTIKIWDLESGKELRSISDTGGYVNAISFSPDGKTLVHGAEDGTVKIWDAETGRSVRTMNHGGYVNEARYSPDGKRIASCSDNKLIKIWETETGKEIKTLAGHTDFVGVVAWSPNGKRLASGSVTDEKTIRIWDVESGQVLQTITGQGGRIVALTFSPDGRRIASSTLEDNAVKIWDAENGSLIKSIAIENSGGVYSLAWSPDGARLVSGAVYGGEGDNGTHIRVWNTETWERVRIIGENGSVHSITWTPDGRRIIAVANFIDAQFIRVCDALSGKEL